MLEERVGSNTSKRYVWSPVYVDALVLRDRDTDGNGTLDERLWVQQDANWNVTALIDGTGTVVERYAYDPFGVRTVYDSGYSVRSGGSSHDFQHGHQGMTFDTTAGLSPQRFRWYSPTLGRWVTLDPIRFAGGDVNLYGFVLNGPVQRIDSMGLFGSSSGATSAFPLSTPHNTISINSEAIDQAASGTCAPPTSQTWPLPWLDSTQFHTRTPNPQAGGQLPPPIDVPKPPTIKPPSIPGPDPSEGFQLFVAPIETFSLVPFVLEQFVLQPLQLFFDLIKPPTPLQMEPFQTERPPVILPPSIPGDDG